MNEQRFIDIETKLAFQEDAVQQLLNVICEQQKRLDRLESACKILSEQIKAMALDSGDVKPAHEKPPHY
jgi:SlyX protein